MGCTGSSPVPVSGKVSKCPSMRTPAQKPPCDTRATDFQEITVEWCGIAKISDINPVVCLSKESFPVLESSLFLDDYNPTDVSLPIVAATRFGNGKVVAVGGSSFLRESIRNTADTEIFIMSICQWCNKSNNRQILLCGFPDDLAEDVKSYLQQSDFEAEIAPSLETLGSAGMLLVSSSVPAPRDGLLTYVKNGGGLICFFDHGNKDAFNMNSFLLEVGLSFTYCNFVVGSRDSHKFSVSQKFSDVAKLTLEGACERYINYIKGGTVQSDMLDSLVTFLKFHLIVSGNVPSAQVQALARHSCDFLVGDEYRSGGRFCSKMEHVIIIILLIRLLHKLPVGYMKELSDRLECWKFPGLCGDVELGCQKIELECSPKCWMSTGLWLPAGQIARVCCQGHVNTELRIQIGSHSESIISKQSPWKRWPNVTMIYLVSDCDIEIVSPFGGLIYVIASENVNLTLEFDNVARAPVAAMGKPELWSETKDIDVPWCELQSPNFIFTVPASFARDHESEIDKLFDVFTRLTNHVIEFTAAQPLSKPYRVVFDPEVIDKEQQYPLIFDIQDIDLILVTEKPTAKLLHFLTVLSCLFIRKYCDIDVDTETAIGVVCACVGILSVWPDSDPVQLLGDNVPMLFNEFWLIYKEYDKTLISKTLASFHQTSGSAPDASEDMWINFFREMCRIGNVNFTSVVQHVRPVPLNVSVALKKLPEAVPPNQ